MVKVISEFTHKCGLINDQRNTDIVSQYVDVGVCINTRRYFRRLTMVSYEHPATKFYIRSIPAMRNEEIYHLLHRYGIIHPLSKFLLYRQFLMFFVLSGFYVILPFVLLLLKSERIYILTGMSILQIIFMMEMVMTFFTGYCDGNKIVLKPKYILLKYLKTYLIWDLISVIPFFARQVWKIYYGDTILQYWKLLLVCENFKIVRYFYWFGCYQLMMAYYEVPKSISSGTGLLIRICFILLFAFSIRHCVQNLDGHTIDFHNLKSQVFRDFYDMIVEILGVAYGVEKESKFRKNVISVLYLCAGFGFLVKIMCLFWQHLNKFFATAFSETVTYSQYEAYASYTGLSSELKERICMYLDFKYQGEYYKEHIIKNIISTELMEETRTTVSRSRLEKVKLFSAVPDALKVKLEERLLSDIFLPGDIIIKDGTKGNYLYFIVSGTVIVISATGDHICCLEDGANFGEIALILNQKRTTTIIAATPCELLALKRSDYESVLNPYPELKKELKKEALQRLHVTVETIAEGPICHLFDPGRPTRSKLNSMFYKSEEERQAFVEAIHTRSSLVVLPINTPSKTSVRKGTIDNTDDTDF